MLFERQLVRNDIRKGIIDFLPEINIISLLLRIDTLKADATQAEARSKGAEAAQKKAEEAEKDAEDAKGMVDRMENAGLFARIFRSW